MSAPLVVGIDPGLRGGIAFLRGEELEAHDIPLAGNEIDLDEVLRLLRHAKVDMALIEAAGAMPKQGVASTFKFGVAVGMLRGCLAACWIETHIVSASVWKRHFKLDRDKEKSRALAIRLWPGTGYFSRKSDHGRAEASLLARYGAEVLWRRS